MLISGPSTRAVLSRVLVSISTIYKSCKVFPTILYARSGALGYSKGSLPGSVCSTVGAVSRISPLLAGLLSCLRVCLGGLWSPKVSIAGSVREVSWAAYSRHVPVIAAALPGLCVLWCSVSIVLIGLSALWCSLLFCLQRPAWIVCTVVLCLHRPAWIVCTVVLIAVLSPPSCLDCVYCGALSPSSCLDCLYCGAYCCSVSTGLSALWCLLLFCLHWIVSTVVLIAVLSQLPCWDCLYCRAQFCSVSGLSWRWWLVRRCGEWSAGTRKQSVLYSSVLVGFQVF